MGLEANRPSTGIGKRLANYRRLANMSAQELSSATSGRISRTVISNIENGRKADVTIDELIHLSLALGVPPVALALPIDEPFREFEITYGLCSNTAELMLWFQGNSSGFGAFMPNDPTSVMPFPRSTATAVSNEIIQSVTEYKKTAELLDRAIDIFPASALGDAENKVDTLSKKLLNLGIDLTRHPSDGPAT
ncbi:transcriptional regulator with XRE-family HTH domain [Aurantimicrobium minutum]|uniref:helix-turn-helix domain-containing protein n=1 Tax=Aurantimicrobium minutum TaxID=708131 RepID=UPI0024074C32|nr:helix-turn-helix transcriptional regulator [Aurantimicrobium minutum]MDF9809846.1 transcriptional regulator with XRE-family HTH domain [Aurantimicrobium minutum]